MSELELSLVLLKISLARIPAAPLSWVVVSVCVTVWVCRVCVVAQWPSLRLGHVFLLLSIYDSEREIFEDQQEITTLTVIWPRQLVSPQPKLGPVP